MLLLLLSSSSSSLLQPGEYYKARVEKHLWNYLCMTVATVFQLVRVSC